MIPEPGTPIRVMRHGSEIAAGTVAVVVDGIDGLHTVLAIADAVTGEQRTFVVDAFATATTYGCVAFASSAATPEGAEP